jgi:hypothetical protein
LALFRPLDDVVAAQTQHHHEPKYLVSDEPEKRDHRLSQDISRTGDEKKRHSEIEDKHQSAGAAPAAAQLCLLNDERYLYARLNS